MPTAFQIMFALIFALLVLSIFSAAHRLRRRHRHGKELGKARPGSRSDL